MADSVAFNAWIPCLVPVYHYRSSVDSNIFAADKRFELYHHYLQYFLNEIVAVLSPFYHCFDAPTWVWGWWLSGLRPGPYLWSNHIKNKEITIWLGTDATMLVTPQLPTPVFVVRWYHSSSDLWAPFQENESHGYNSAKHVSHAPFWPCAAPKQCVASGVWCLYPCTLLQTHCSFLKTL